MKKKIKLTVILLILSLLSLLILSCGGDDDDDSNDLSIEIESPLDGAHVFENVHIEAEASGEGSISYIEIYFDNALIHSSTSNPAIYDHDISSLEMRSGHEIYAIVEDVDGNTATSEVINIIIDNFGLTVCNIQQRSIMLNWNKRDVSGFARYTIVKDVSSGLTIADEQIATITNDDDTSFTVNGLEPNSDYYFKVFALTLTDTISTNEVHIHTMEAVETVVDTEMVFIPTTTFTRGNVWGGVWGGNDDTPASRITVSAFYIDKYEVTYRRYQEFIDAGGYDNEAYWSSDGLEFLDNLIDDPPKYWDDERYHVGEDYPIVGVSYYEAEAFANWCGKRLPTEAEWELAARGNGGTDIDGDSNPDGFMYPWGTEFHPDGQVMCSYQSSIEYDSDGYDDGFETSAPIGSFPNGQSSFGVSDMAGNTVEWCSDWWNIDYYATAPSLDPTGPVSGERKVVRGGSHNSISAPDSVLGGFYFRTYIRQYKEPDDQRHFIGFRLAKDAD